MEAPLGSPEPADQNGRVKSPKARKIATWIEDRPPRRGGPPAPVAQVLAEFQRSASRKAGAALTPDEWQRIVGPKIAARTRVGRLTRGTLTVHAASSAWCNELSLLTTEIVDRLRQAGWAVDDLRVRVGAFSEAPSSPARRSAEQRTELPAELQARFALIDDPELRSAIAEAASLSLSHATRRKP